MFTTNEVGEAINQTFAIIGYFVTVLLVAIALAFTYEKLADSYRKWRKRRSPSYIPEGMFTWPSSIFTVNETRRARGVGPVIPAWPAKMGEDKDKIPINYNRGLSAPPIMATSNCDNKKMHVNHYWKPNATADLRWCLGMDLDEQYCVLSMLPAHKSHNFTTGEWAGRPAQTFFCPGYKE